MVILDCWKQPPHWLGRHEHSPQIHLVRSPSPNCHCSCHYNYRLFEQSRSQASGASAAHRDESHVSPRADQQTHSKSGKRNDTFLSSQKSSTFGLKSSSVPYKVKERVTTSSRESNYWDITDLYECPAEKSRRSESPSASSSHYHRLYAVNWPKPVNILHLVRVNPFKLSTMEPLHVDNRLIVFSLLDSFTKLSPNKIFENYIKKLKEEGKRSITVFNLSESIEHMRESLDVPICEFGWPERHTPSLEKLCALCKAIDSWIALDSVRNVAVLYSKRDLSRASLAIAVFLQYVSICLGEDSTFDYESMQAYFECNLQEYLQPSQKRYIGYFKDLLSGESHINSQQFHLNCMVIRKIPNFEGNGLCRPFIKIYQGMQLVYSSPILCLDAKYLKNYDFIVFPLKPPLKLRGEILIKCYHKRTNPSARTGMFSLQFHTGTQLTEVAVFAKDSIDIAVGDKRFHPDTQVELMFNDAHLESLPDVDCIEDDQITKWNSYENFFTDDSSLEYTKGPLDGSLYATVSKRSSMQSPTSNPVTDERKLDELLNEIFLEIESFPDIAPSPEPRESQSTAPALSQSPQTSPQLITMTVPRANSQPPREVSPVVIVERSAPRDDDSIDSIDGLNLTWLQKQQLKLQNKRNKSFHKRNIVEKQLIEELKYTLKGPRSAPFDETDGTVGPSTSTPTIPVRTSSKNLVPLFAEQHDLGQPVPTLSMDQGDHSPTYTNGSTQYTSRVKYSTIPSQTRAPELNGNTNASATFAKSLEQYDSAGLRSPPLQRPITPSFPVKDQRHSRLLHSPSTDSSSGSVPMFIKDTSAFWYKPHISREEAIKLLSDKPSGTFIIRDSNSFQGAFGLALKVSRSDDNVADSVRHFLIESTNKGVQIKGCLEEPVFSSLAALVYQHSITRISLPTPLLIPSEDIIEAEQNESYLLRIYENGAACNVIYFACEEVESLTGDAAIRKVTDNLLRSNQIKPTMVHFKASNKGITLTDNSHKVFFRQHFPLPSISHCSLDPENRTLIYQQGSTQIESVLFGFVARKKGSTTDNEALIFGQFESDQPSHAIVDFVNKLKSL